MQLAMAGATCTVQPAAHSHAQCPASTTPAQPPPWRVSPSHPHSAARTRTRMHACREYQMRSDAGRFEADEAVAELEGRMERLDHAVKLVQHTAAQHEDRIASLMYSPGQARPAVRLPPPSIPCPASVSQRYSRQSSRATLVSPFCIPTHACIRFLWRGRGPLFSWPLPLWAVLGGSQSTTVLSIASHPSTDRCLCPVTMLPSLSLYETCRRCVICESVWWKRGHWRPRCTLQCLDGSVEAAVARGCCLPQSTGGHRSASEGTSPP